MSLAGGREVGERWRALAAAAEALRGALDALDAAGRLGPVAHRLRYRVRVAPPRRGRDRGCWCLRVYGPGEANGQRELTEIRHEPRTRARAEGEAKRRQAELNGEGLPLGAIYAQWVAQRARAGRLSKRTLANHEVAGRWLEGSRFAGVMDGGLTAGVVVEVREALTESLRVATARLYLGMISQAWRWAHMRGLVAQGWPSGLPPWRTPVSDRTRKRAYSEAELADLLKHLATWQGGHYLGLGWVLAESAARIGSVVPLRVGDVRVLADGSGLVTIGRTLGPGATKGRTERTSAISPGAVGALDLLRPDRAWLFPSRRGESRHLSARSFRDAVTAWLKTRDLVGLRDVHSLRRRGAAELHRQGVPTEIGRQITGQSTEVFMSYAAKADYDLTEERRILWVDVDRSRTGDHAQSGNDAAVSPSLPDPTSSCIRRTPETRAAAGARGGHEGSLAGPALRRRLRGLPGDPWVSLTLRSLFGGGSG